MDVDLSAPPEVGDSYGTPWNRRKRRSIQRSKPGEVLFHLFAGHQKWRCPGVVVEVEKSRGGDLLSPRIFQHVLRWSMMGVVGAVIGGPPCRTASRCRSYEDDGPPPVRDRDQGRWGLSGLDGNLMAAVQEDSVLWLRFLLVYAVAQASADEAPCAAIPAVYEPKRVREPSTPLDIPVDAKDPVELAKWALRQAACRLGAESSHAEGQEEAVDKVGQQRKELRNGASRRVLFGWEHPADPEEYMPPEARPRGGWVSWWAFPEWRAYAQVYGIHEARLDQGCFGHSRPKPTVFATNSWFLYESLHMRVLTRLQRARFGTGPASGQARLQQSPLWGRWAPGLTACVIQAWVYWGREQGLWDEVQLRKAMLTKLKEEEAWRRHLDSDHVPFRKGCPVCVAAQGRQRCHWRSTARNVSSASFDLAGPFISGRGYDPAASGRDRGLGYKYFLACAYTLAVRPAIPDHEEPKEPPVVLEGSGCVEELPSMEELFGDRLGAVRARVRGKRPEPLEPATGSSGANEPPSASRPAEPPPLPPPKEPLADDEPGGRGVSSVATRTLCLALPVRSKKGKVVLAAVQLLINKLESSGYPVHRYHADRAQELKSRALVSWLQDKGIHTTWTPGDSPAGNRAELAVQQIKGSARKLLSVARLPSTYWPLAVLHASNRHWVMMAESLGIAQPALLPFGVKLHARCRFATGYDSHWRSRTVQGTYVGQAPQTPGGHLVLVPDDKEGFNVLLTNTVYPLCPTPRDPKPRLRLRTKTAPHLVVKLVKAWPLPELGAAVSLRHARFAPGGEWESEGSSGELSNTDVGFWDFRNCRFDLDQGHALGKQQIGALQEQQAEEIRNRHALEERQAPSELRGCALSEQHAFQGGGGDALLELQTQVYENKASLDRSWNFSENERVQQIVSAATFDVEECLEVLQSCLDTSQKEGLCLDENVGSVLVGLCGTLGGPRVVGGGLSLTKYLNGFVGHCEGQAFWTTLCLSCNELADIRPLVVTDFPCWTFTLGKVKGGGIWVPDESDSGIALRHVPGMGWLTGSVVDARHSFVKLAGGKAQLLEPWKEGNLWVIRAFVARACLSAGSYLRGPLEGAGFRVMPVEQVGPRDTPVEGTGNGAPPKVFSGFGVQRDCP